MRLRLGLPRTCTGMCEASSLGEGAPGYSQARRPVPPDGGEVAYTAIHRRGRVCQQIGPTSLSERSHRRYPRFAWHLCLAQAAAGVVADAVRFLAAPLD